ncbi:MAG: dTDP-glucose 4,6-dehydratase [Gammaproteobacteria bacterium]|nr:dTDP-glucose 4,6-dehydratase [Gammaproteobacteria bacterium]
MSEHNPQSILITGGAGFIGSNFVHHWVKLHPHCNVLVLDALTYAGNLNNISGLIERHKIKFVHANINEQAHVESLLKDNQIDTIVHFAAESHVDRSIDTPDEFIQTNVVGTLSLLKAAKHVWLDASPTKTKHRFHHVSTDEVYGSLSPNEPAFTEQHQYQPNSPYAASKAASDHLVRSYHETYGLNTTISNCSNNYGPYHFPEKLIPLVITNILHNKPIPVYGDGQQVRDWLYVDEHCSAIDRIVRQAPAGEIYNVGGNNEQTNIDIVNLICKMMNNKFAVDPTLANKFAPADFAIKGTSEQLITFVEDRLGHDRRYAINADKIKNTLGFAPQKHFELLLENTIDWYLDNKNWWEKLLHTGSLI